MRLPYEPDDDESADAYTQEALRTHDLTTWRALTSPEYVVQTDRVLRGKLDGIARVVTHRNAKMEQVRGQRGRNEITHEEFEAAKEEWAAWKGRTEHYEATVRRYLRMVADKARAVRGDVIRDEVTAALKAVAAAVHRHRAGTLLDELEPTPSDRALWAHLTMIKVRLHELDDPVTLDSIGRRAEAPSEVDTPTLVPGIAASDTTVLAARLLLELSEHTPTIVRAELSREWSTRAAYLDANRGATEGASKGKGSRSGITLGHLLRGWEKRGFLERRTVDTTQFVEITDREGLAAIVPEQ